MSHLRKKYYQELEYMQREFRRLERQLLGAKTAGAGGGGGGGESAGSRERREKLHSFIVHLTETMDQIEVGCRLEREGKSTVGIAVTPQQQQLQQQQQAAPSSSSSVVASASQDAASASASASAHSAATAAAAAAAAAASTAEVDAKQQFADSAALTKLTREKEEEENVQKLEEHILANLLPVKVRLTKQLAAQQGASRNPAGMPSSRGVRGYGQPSSAAMAGKGTFAAAAEERRRREEAVRLQQQQQQAAAAEDEANGGSGSSGAVLSPPPTTSLLGKPLGGGGSKLTQMLHGSTLGSKKRTAGDGVGQAAAATDEACRASPTASSAAAAASEQSTAMRDGGDGQQQQQQHHWHREPERKRRILYAGMAPGSEQVSSSVSAAQGAHAMVIEDPSLRAVQAAESAVASATGGGALAPGGGGGAAPPPPPPPPPPPGPPPPPPPVPAAQQPGLVHTSGSDSSTASSGGAIAAAAATLQRKAEAAARSAAVAKAQAASQAAALAARAKARAAAGLPPDDSAAAAAAAVAVAGATTAATTSTVAPPKKAGQQQQGGGGRKRYLSDPTLTEEERQRLVRRKDRRKRRRRKARRLERERQRHAAYAAQQRHAQAQSAAAAAAAAAAQAAKAEPPPTKGRKKGGKKGPRTVEYICGLCNETYPSTCEANPWWALIHQDCSKCGKKQIPRIDISAPPNAIEYHPALLAHAEDSAQGSQGGGGAASTAAGSGMVHGALRGHKGPPGAGPYVPGSHLAHHPGSKFCLGVMPGDDSSSDLSDADEGISIEGESSESEDEDVLGFTGGALTPAERAEAEDFGRDYSGPKLTEAEAARLVILIGHASTCPGRHKTAKTRGVCHSTKYMMLHVRDCPGTTSTFDVCPFPWCRKLKHLLYHLVSCRRPEECGICSPKDLSPTLKALTGLTAHRQKKQKESAAAALAAAASAAGSRGVRVAKGGTTATASATYAHLKRGVATTSTKLPQINLPPTKFTPAPSPAPTAVQYTAKPPGVPGNPPAVSASAPITTSAAAAPATAMTTTAMAKSSLPVINCNVPATITAAQATAAVPSTSATGASAAASRTGASATPGIYTAATAPKPTGTVPHASSPPTIAQAGFVATVGPAAQSAAANTADTTSFPPGDSTAASVIVKTEEMPGSTTALSATDTSTTNMAVQPPVTEVEENMRSECTPSEGLAENPSALVKEEVTDTNRVTAEGGNDPNCPCGANACAKDASSLPDAMLIEKAGIAGVNEEAKGAISNAGETKDGDSGSAPGTPPENAVGCSGEVKKAAEPVRVLDE